MRSLLPFLVEVISAKFSVQFLTSLLLRVSSENNWSRFQMISTFFSVKLTTLVMWWMSLRFFFGQEKCSDLAIVRVMEDLSLV